MNIHQWKKQIRNFNKAYENSAPSKQWNRNTRANLSRFNKENSIWSMQWKYTGEEEKAMVLVGSSPCLAEDVKKLKALDDNFIIICANSALKYLLKNGVKPHYVISIDSDDIDIPQHLDIEENDIILLASSVTCAKALDNWKGPIWYAPYYSINKKMKPILRGKLGRSVPCGGNSITQALVICTVIWGGHTVIFVANELCLDKKYYADPKAAKQEEIKRLYPAVDVKGRERWTLPALYNYAIWTERVCTDLSPPGYFIDTSFGMLGKDRSAIHVVELSEAIEQVRNAFRIKKELNKLDMKEKITDAFRKAKNDKSQVYRYNVQEQQGEILRLARS